MEESTMHLISGAPVNFWQEQAAPGVLRGSCCYRKILLCIWLWCRVLDPEVFVIALQTVSVWQARMLK